MILEDDIHFNFDIFELIKNVNDLTSDDEVTLFFYQCKDVINLNKNDAVYATPDSSLYRTSGKLNLMSTGGYMIGKAACKKMTGYLLPIRSAPDCWRDFNRDGILDKINILYPIPLNSAYFESTLGYHKNKIIAVFTRIINKYKLPVLYQFLVYRRKSFYSKTRRINVK